ncbi:acetyl-CoA carboxylase biotin carboxyl carrier protein subunit [Pedobacter mucosus]|uniref:acetyl-CoA carboxylase biotin carboxyl carrier protein subunit n=1 Tax=Pedobacter mucosus TaxID=2895286 RepID=UPI001EE4792C|nr:acetyl-CoA carboxylase biotin carboxyl carrier protein subunit [Pedobacter mucosus]UKT63346.1 biotin/lipoyl-binding protein [Pedobacter mucosus]
MQKVKVGEQFLYEIEFNNAKIIVDNSDLVLDISETGSGFANVIYKNGSFNTEVVEINTSDKSCKIKVNGNIYTVSIEDQYDQLLKQLGLDNLTANKILEVKAPMPGLVLNIFINEGGEVKKGDNLLILEAMKMENILKASADGTVKKISISKGDKVEKNQVLIQFI